MSAAPRQPVAIPRDPRVSQVSQLPHTWHKIQKGGSTDRSGYRLGSGVSLAVFKNQCYGLLQLLPLKPGVIRPVLLQRLRVYTAPEEPAVAIQDPPAEATISVVEQVRHHLTIGPAGSRPPCRCGQAVTEEGQCRLPCRMEFAFTGDIWYWRGPAPFYFISVPEDICEIIKVHSGFLTYGSPVCINCKSDLQSMHDASVLAADT